MAYSTFKIATVTIADDADLTDAVDIRDGEIAGFIVPSNFDGTAILFHVSHDNETYTPLYNASNAAVGLTVGASRAYPCPSEVNAFRFMKIETVTDQATDDTEFIVVMK